MKRGRRWLRMRTAGLPVVVALAALLAGDRPARMAPPAGVGIDPLEVLDQQVRNNVLIVLDTSQSMKYPFDKAAFSVGGDDPASRLQQVKRALAAAITANQSRANIGLATFNVLDADKTINRDQDAEGDTRADGPFVYVSADAAAQNFYIPRLCQATGLSNDGFFCNVSNVFDDYNDPVGPEIFRSFSNVGGPNQLSGFNDPYPQGCVPGAGQLAPVTPGNGPAMRCRYYMQSRLLRNDRRYTWDRTTGLLLTESAIPGGCAAFPPPPGLVSHAAPPCFQIQDGLVGGISTFYYSSSIFQDQTASTCPGGGALIAETDNGSCTGNAPATLAKLDLELPLADIPAPPGGASFDYGDGHLDGDQATVRGLRADQASMPLEATLQFIRSTGTPVFPPQADPRQRNFVILITASDDSCAVPGDLDQSAVRTAKATEDLLNSGPDFRHTASTIVVGIGGSVSPPRLDAIAQGGSGATIDVNLPLNQAVTGCRAGSPCFNALMAQDTRQLATMIDAALERAGATGIFSATQSVFDGVPEYVRTVDPSPNPTLFNPMDPESRYQAQAFRSYRASFNGSNFDGFVRAFDQAGPVPGWEAGQKLLDRVSPNLFIQDHTFQEMTSSTAPGTPIRGYDFANSDTMIDRRIFTTSQNGRSLGAFRVDIWGSNIRTNGVAPASGTGSLDTVLFRKADNSQMVLLDFQAPPFRACLGSNLPADCSSTNATTRLNAHKKEAREMILAYTAGAEAQRDAAGNPRRDAGGNVLYRARRWILAESTLGTPALVTPPLSLMPSGPAATGINEYLLYRDGPRTSSQQNPRTDDGDIVLQGFGLRNPDRDGREQPRGTLSRPLLKPVMSVLYVPANDMLHAFRAGPCPVPPFAPSGGSLDCASFGSTETGGEELWAYVPHDLLPKLKDRLLPQTRTSHTYMLAASLRFADVFVPSARFTVQGIDYFGRWRRVLMFGRGIGGKYYSALDITGVGAFTRHSLGTKLPTVLWNRGNPDTVDGLPGGTAIRAADTQPYLDMGQTWSTPAIGQFSGGFRAVMGSGYGTASREGTRFYVMNPMNGDILDADATLNVGEGSQTLFENALVANPVIYAGELLVAGVDLPHPSSVRNRYAYIGDIHGRLWRYDPGASPRMQLFRNLGIDQPVGVAGALLNLGDPYFFVTTGADARVAPPVEGFKMFGFRDSGPPYPAGVVSTPVSAPDFSIDFPNPPPDKGAYRGTLQPVTAFRGSSTAGTGVVFFTGTRFNPPVGPCGSTTFDTIIFGAVGSTGGAAYATTEYAGVKAVGVPRPPVPSTTPGVAPVDQGTPQPGQEPEAAQVPANKIGGPSKVTTRLFRPGSAVCR